MAVSLGVLDVLAEALHKHRLGPRLGDMAAGGEAWKAKKSKVRWAGVKRGRRAGFKMWVVMRARVLVPSVRQCKFSYVCDELGAVVVVIVV
jgi:hypothetical protein